MQTFSGIHKEIMIIKSTKNAEHYKWGHNCDGWYLLKTDTLSVIQERIPVGGSEILHFHYFSQQLFYVLSGVATFEIEGKTYIVNANESIHIPKMTKHRISNKGDEVLTFIVISEPKSHGDRHDL